VNIKEKALKVKIEQEMIDNKLVEYKFVVSKIEEFWDDYAKTKGENILMYN